MAQRLLWRSQGIFSKQGDAVGDVHGVELLEGWARAVGIDVRVVE